MNLIGEHTDYTGGWVLPMAIDRDIALVGRRCDEPAVELLSLEYGERASFRLASLQKNPRQTWLNYPQGVAWVLQQAGYRLRGIQGVVAGDVPIGSGLSSSAAFEVASALSFCAASDLAIEPLTLARLCQRAENEFVGMKCGIMDQYVSLFAREDHALLIDCLTLDHQAVPLPPSKVTVLVCDTGVKRDLVFSEYNVRRAECEEVLALIASQEKGVARFRDIRPHHLEKHSRLLGEKLLRRARHVVSENQRVRDSVAALHRGDVEGFGRLVNASHESLRDDYEVSCAELDTMVELARQQEGTLGARMVGGGFGGCTVNLVRPDAVEAARRGISEGYRCATGKEPATYVFRAASGARVESFVGDIRGCGRQRSRGGARLTRKETRPDERT